MKLSASRFEASSFRFRWPLWITAGLALIPGPPVARAACLISGVYADVLRVLPTSAANEVYPWSSSQNSAVYPLTCAAMQPNPGGLSAATGTLSLAVASSLTITADLSLASTPGSAPAFPEVIYGYKPQGAVLSTQAAPIQFPVAVDHLTNLWLVSNSYLQLPDPTLPAALAYNFSLSQDLMPTALRTGDIQLQVWLYHQALAPSGTLLPGQTFTTPMWVDGTLQDATFDVYALANPGASPSSLVTFALRQTSVPVALQGGQSSGTLAFNLQPLLVHMERALQAELGTSTTLINGEYLNGIEFGPALASTHSTTRATLSIDSFCFVRPKTGVPPTQADAANFVCPSDGTATGSDTGSTITPAPTTTASSTTTSSTTTGSSSTASTTTGSTTTGSATTGSSSTASTTTSPTTTSSTTTGSSSTASTTNSSTTTSSTTTGSSSTASTTSSPTTTGSSSTASTGPSSPSTGSATSGSASSGSPSSSSNTGSSGLAPGCSVSVSNPLGSAINCILDIVSSIDSSLGTGLGAILTHLP